MLTIKGIHKLIGESFIDDRFLFTNFEETPTHLKFWFKDCNSNKMGFFHFAFNAVVTNVNCYDRKLHRIKYC